MLKSVHILFFLFISFNSTRFPDAGHLLHMPTHIDVLIGDYEACVNWNMAAIIADKKSMTLHPSFSKQTSFYFGYIVHDYHMLGKFFFECPLIIFRAIAPN